MPAGAMPYGAGAMPYGACACEWKDEWGGLGVELVRFALPALFPYAW
jgi:hypothetical protein